MLNQTYTLNPTHSPDGQKNYYKRNQLEKMTTFQLKEICRKEHLAITSVGEMDREGFIHLIMRFRGQKDYRHITDFVEGGMERLQKVIDGISVHTIDDGNIKVPARLFIYEDMEMDELDGMVVESESVSLYEGNLLLVDEHFMLHTCLYLKKTEQGYLIAKGKKVSLITPAKHQYSILYFPNEEVSDYIYARYHDKNSHYPGTISCLRLPLLEFSVGKAEETQNPLVIDFGSANTTMGICLPDGSRKIAVCGNGHIIPSLAGIVESMPENNNAEYIFGYEAAKIIRDNYRDQDIPVFYDIKRWISNPNRDEVIILDNGIKISVNRMELLKGFFSYLLEEAEKQFKCRFKKVEVLAPIRQKEKFTELLSKLIPGIEIRSSLDEGMAVLYSGINSLINEEKYEPDNWYNVLIFDCGGGTTDLTSGRFKIRRGRVSYDIELETGYEDGDTNFGGYNLTYRIMQLIKIRIYQELTGSSDAVNDEKEFNEAYKTASRIIPTAFEEYADKGREEYFFVKNNYYYLFDLAEQIKKCFFHSDSIYELWLSTESDKGELSLDKWKLSIMKNDGHLVRLDKKIRFPLYLNQIEALLRPDIYRLMKRFFESRFYKKELDNYHIIKLTGQSCKSRLFEEALKEYVPGILIQRSGGYSQELKICCLEGALYYFYNCERGYMNVTHKYRAGSLPYEIMADTYEGKPKVLLHSMDKDGHIGFISRFMLGKKLDIHLLDSTGATLKTYYCDCGMNDFVPTSQDDIDKDYQGTVIQTETDVIAEGEIKYFVWADRKRWGFIVLPVLRDKECLYKGKEQFFDFEDDTWEENFFDGRK